MDILVEVSFGRLPDEASQHSRRRLETDLPERPNLGNG
jgi:hypothetical protein